ncbi:tartrate dehydrogenase [Anaeromyxobacter paludicola]|uniref:D-malate dehydrogenase (decarboxylating) n=1 Tax=Anaeromyxobacter paludicola TaxID=2918171 RepID=A0ABM7XDP1_9BACT|nr:tartrate dehydrogenase [Anaeromyxobacter paludicola]BDG10001.1 tartrate dehydrogenase [Anaeromyxobacter paludicola]
MRTRHQIAVIPGDGIGREVVPAAISVLEAAGRRHGFELAWKEYDWSCERYARTGQMMPEDGLDQLRPSDAIFLGAVGYPGVPDHVSLWGLLLPIRRGFAQYACVRPLKLLPGVTTPLAGRAAKDIDLVVVRENNEGEYSKMGGRIYEGTDDELVIQEAVFTRRGVDRILAYAFELAGRRRGHVTSATKSNGIFHSMPFWDERFALMAARHPGVRTAQYHIDILSAHFVQHPDWFDVVVASNLFGDILSDLGAAIAGSIGVAASGNVNPERTAPSMFEPTHGSAPDIAGKGIANPVAQVWSGAMMLEHLGHPEAARDVERAIEAVLSDPATRTRDLGGRATTREVADALAQALR